MKNKRNPLVILCYHGLNADTDTAEHLNDFCFLPVSKFSRDLDEVIRCGWSVVDLNEGITGIRDSSLPKPSVAISFDDGFADTLQKAEPLLKSRSMTATVFIPAQLSRNGSAPWFTKVIEIIHSAKSHEFVFFGHRIPIASAGEKSRASILIQNALKELHPIAIQNIVCQMAYDNNCHSSKERTDYLTISETECRAAYARGTLKFGAHSDTHAIHSKLHPTELEREINESCDYIKSILRSQTCLYAYPNGRRADLSPICASLLRNAGVAAAFTTIPGWNRKFNEPYAMRRFCVGLRTNIGSILNSTFWEVLSHI
jgi:peptidoglycan/xylan/chitin deacetylase (PgdA/CDA1 family)